MEALLRDRAASKTWDEDVDEERFLLLTRARVKRVQLSLSPPAEPKL